MIFDTDFAAVGEWANSKFALITQAGYKVDLEINNNTFVITPKLYDKNNNLISTGTSVDLPLESVVVNGSYDNTNQKIILTLKNGNTVDIPVSGLVSGLYSKPSDGIPKSDLASAVRTKFIWYGTCSTSASDADKVATLVDGEGFALTTGVLVAIKFDYASTAAPMTLAVNSTDAKTIMQYGTTQASSGTSTTGWVAGAMVLFVYDGTNWVRSFWSNTTYSKMSQTEANTGTATSARSITAQVLSTTINNKIAGKADKATTLAGYGITDAKIASGVITLGENTITPLTSHQDITGKADKSEMSITTGSGTATIQLKSGTSATVLTEHQDISGKADKPTTTTVTIATTDWSSLSCTKSVTGMTASKIVLVSPAPASFTAYTDAGVRCSAQGSGTLSFACDSVPSSSVTVNILILHEAMANRGAVTGQIDGLTTTSYNIQEGYHNGNGTVSLTSAIETELSNI